jgi:hypothetical protein
MYRPATGINVGGEIAFKFIHFSYQKNLPLLQPGVPDGFNASHQRFGFDMGGRVFGVEMDYQKNKGFYIFNNTIIPDSAYSDPSIVNNREDLSSVSFGLNMRFTFSNKLSANALFDQSERQLKSKGAFTMIVGDRFHNFTADSAFIPTFLEANYNQTKGVNQIWVNNFQFLPGYGYIAVAGKWNIGLFLYSGTGLQIRKYFNETDDKLGLRIPFIAKGKGGISYNGRNFYTKLSAMANYSTVGMKDADIKWLQTAWEFSIGFRFYENK